MTRTNVLPPPTTLEEVAAVCERNARNCMLNILDCEDCQDCSESELFIYNNQRAEWLQLAADVRAMSFVK